MTDKQFGAPDAVEVEVTSKRKRRHLFLWIFGPAVVIAVAGWMYLTSGRYVSTDNAYIGANQINIAPQVSGRVAEVDVGENQAVHKGEVLFRIDPEPLQIAEQRMRAQMDTIHSLLNAARAGYASAQASLDSATEAMRVAKRQYERMKQLRAKGLVAQKALDDAANNYADTKGTRDADVAALSKAQSLLGGLPATPDQDLAGYKLAAAEYAQTKLNLAHATVRAPVDGVIGKTDLQPGDFLQVGQPAMPLVAVHVWVDANFKETDLTHVKVGQPVRVEVDAYPDHVWKGRVQSISPASGARFSVLPAQNATGNWVKIVQRIPIRIAIDDQSDGPTLRAGMSSNVEIDTGQQNSLLGRIEGAHSQPQSRVAAAKE